MDNNKCYEYEVYLKDNECFLKIKLSNNKEIFYSIKDDGEAVFLETPPKNLNDPNFHFEDHCSVENINKIFILASRPNFDNIVFSFNELLKKMKSDQYNYKFTDFSMDMAYKIEDYKDALQQIYDFSKDEDDLNKLKEVTKESDELFYNKTSELPLDRDNISNFLIKNVKYIESLKSQ